MYENYTVDKSVPQLYNNFKAVKLMEFMQKLFTGKSWLKKEDMELLNGRKCVKMSCLKYNKDSVVKPEDPSRWHQMAIVRQAIMTASSPQWCTVYSVQEAVSSDQCTSCSVNCTLYIVHCLVFSVQLVLCIVKSINTRQVIVLVHMVNWKILPLHQEEPSTVLLIERGRSLRGSLLVGGGCHCHRIQHMN